LSKIAASFRSVWDNGMTHERVYESLLATINFVFFSHTAQALPRDTSSK
jgi:hypothetical protein